MYIFLEILHVREFLGKNFGGAGCAIFRNDKRAWYSREPYGCMVHDALATVRIAVPENDNSASMTAEGKKKNRLLPSIKPADRKSVV